MYVKPKDLVDGVTSYECEKRRQNNKQKQGQCKAKLKIRGDDLVSAHNEHTHAPEVKRGEILKVRQRINDRAVDT